MIIEKTIRIDIDIDAIIASADLTSSSSWNEVREAVEDYVAGLDDCEYYNIDHDDINTICKAIRHFRFSQKKKEEEDDADIAMRESLGENWW